ncbi:MAG: LysR family transcriptional regulator, partial [Bdellovibrionales bacterium]|nr:LysR family transcriptional regulator [Bdellovibrionales bacterium]
MYAKSLKLVIILTLDGVLETIDKIKIFERVAATTSFTKAAAELALPKSTVSNAIQELEQSLSVRLLHRTTRQVSLTFEGEKYLDRCRILISDLEETQSMFLKKSEQIKGKVRIDIATSMANRTIIPHLPELLQKHPQLEVEISCTDQTIDLVRSGVDCAIRSGAISQLGTFEKLLGDAPMSNFVSPLYIEKYGTPKSLEDLKKHRLIFYS